MELKEFEQYKKHMDKKTILAYAKYGFICKQVNDNLFKELKK